MKFLVEILQIRMTEGEAEYKETKKESESDIIFRKGFIVLFLVFLYYGNISKK